MSGTQVFTGLFRRFRAFVLRRDVEVVGQCRLCGKCCRDILLRDGGRWLRREKQFHALCESDPAHACFRITGRDEYGFLVFTCSKIGDDNICTSYESRPTLCSHYPSKSLYYRGGWLRGDCGFTFRETTFREVVFRRKSRSPNYFAEVLQGQIDQEKNKRAS